MEWNYQFFIAVSLQGPDPAVRHPAVHIPELNKFFFLNTNNENDYVTVTTTTTE